MNNQNRLLDDAIKIGSEAEIDARDIKIDLERQSRQLEGTGNNVHRIHGNLSAGNKLIDAMMRHEMRNKWLLYCIIASLIVAALILGYFMLT